MRRLEDDEMPLPLCLCWTKDGVSGLDKRKFVLQENDTGEIMVNRHTDTYTYRRTATHTTAFAQSTIHP